MNLTIVAFKNYKRNFHKNVIDYVALIKQCKTDYRNDLFKKQEHYSKIYRYLLRQTACF